MHLPGRGSSRLDVSADTLRRRVGGGTLQAERDELGRRMIHGPERASFARELHRAERTNNGSSARHRLAGIVTDVILGDVSARVEIRPGPFRVVSVLRRDPAEELTPESGVPAVAVIKSTHVVVERPWKSPTDSSGRNQRE
jgi:molybdopterin-binding protein